MRNAYLFTRVDLCLCHLHKNIFRFLIEDVTPKIEGVVICNNCGEQITKKSKFCEFCGETVS